MRKIVLLGGMLAVPVILLLGIYFLVWPLISGLSLPIGSKSSLSNTEILIDRSLLMNQPYWGGRSKLKFAQQIIGSELLTGIPQIKPPFLDIAPAGIPPNIIPHSKSVKCGLMRPDSLKVPAFIGQPLYCQA